jgi:hypothetical protein
MRGSGGKGHGKMGMEGMGHGMGRSPHGKGEMDSYGDDEE